MKEMNEKKIDRLMELITKNQNIEIKTNKEDCELKDVLDLFEFGEDEKIKLDQNKMYELIYRLINKSEEKIKQSMARNLEEIEEAFNIVKNIALENLDKESKDIDCINRFTKQHEYCIKTLKHYESIK